MYFCSHKDTRLSQLVVINELWPVSMDQSIEGKTILPAVEKEKK